MVVSTLSASNLSASGLKVFAILLFLLACQVKTWPTEELRAKARPSDAKNAESFGFDCSLPPAFSSPLPVLFFRSSRFSSQATASCLAFSSASMINLSATV